MSKKIFAVISHRNRNDRCKKHKCPSLTKYQKSPISLVPLSPKIRHKGNKLLIYPAISALFPFYSPSPTKGTTLIHSLFLLYLACSLCCVCVSKKEQPSISACSLWHKFYYKKEQPLAYINFFHYLCTRFELVPFQPNQQCKGNNPTTTTQPQQPWRYI